MKILSIRLKNLASIEGLFEVDFTLEPLLSAGIFAISGPTGAGKSTILDALCLALYDNAPRFAASSENVRLQDVGENQINQSDVRNILRRGAGDGFAEVDFVAATGRRYRSCWSVRRARNKPTGSLQPQVIQVIDLDTQEELQGTKTDLLVRLVALVGLTYDQFTRTVLLAQNDFATFLKSKESAKAELLEKLTGTEIYSQISREIYAHSKGAEESFRKVKESVGLIEILPQEEVDHITEGREKLIAVRKQGVERLSILKDQLATLHSLTLQQEALITKKKQQGVEQERLKELEVELGLRKKNLEEFRQHWEDLQPDLHKARELDVQIQTAQVVYKEAYDVLQLAQKKTKEGRREVGVKEEHLLTNYGQLQSTDLQKIIANEVASIAPVDVALSNWREKYLSVDTSLLKKEAIANLQFSATNILASDDKKELTHGIESTLQQAEFLSSQGEELLVLLQKADDELLKRLNSFGIDELAKEQKRLAQEQNALQKLRQTALDWGRLLGDLQGLASQIATLRASRENNTKEMSILTRDFQGKEEQVRALQRIYDNARAAINQSVEELRKGLLEGRACPVCGSKEHPYSTHEEVAETICQGIEVEYRVALEESKKLNDRIISLKSELTSLEREENKNRTQFTSRLREEEQLTMLLIGHLDEKTAHLIKLGIDGDDVVCDEGKQGDILQEHLVHLAYRKQESETLFARFEQQLESVNVSLEALSEKLQEYQRLYKEWQDREDKLKLLRVHCITLRDAISSSRLLFQELGGAKEKLNLLLVSEEKEQQRFTIAKNDLQRYQTARKALLRGKTVEDAELAVKRKENELNTLLEEGRKKVDACRSMISGLQGEIRQLSLIIEDLEKKKALIEFPDQLSEAITEQQRINEENDRNYSLLEAKLLQQEQNRIRLKSIEKELEAKQEIALKWEKLNKLIGSADGNKFKVIAQSYTLNLLLLHANKHLSYLSRRYKLQQVPDTLALQVVDGDMCDEVRTVYSLSGGESFLISLALALGLSSLSSNNLQVESLFIDEGFGSLDADSLRTAMEALEMLQMQGRKIGVISHVQEMSERIAVQVQVHKSINGKSAIKVSSI
ncbi:AAA family ATPase [uncultured Bacteroides sp.]|uniref:AAA family ATPase n=1 Tax=uncultured Bacteroides sp. TaxID=162156 RepID=UPI002AAC494F|nr:AAA family ATPase [uncultured Bacteroides sp.]